jgi:hypothetical protein
MGEPENAQEGGNIVAQIVVDEDEYAAIELALSQVVFFLNSVLTAQKRDVGTRAVRQVFAAPNHRHATLTLSWDRSTPPSAGKPAVKLLTACHRT